MRALTASFASALVLGSAAAAGCSDADSATVAPGTDADAGSVPAPAGSTSPDAGAPPAVTAPCDAGDGPPAPATPDEAGAWLRSRAYLCWARESSVHPSAGPHGGNVRTSMNAALVGALTTNTERPVGAVAVKELYGSGTTDVTGWAMMVKTKTGTAKDSWYWYEVFGTTPGASTIEGQGKALCEGCHAAGTDYTLTPFPLR